ncbi:hypothetical protein [Virgibacillus kimchii]
MNKTVFIPSFLFLFMLLGCTNELTGPPLEKNQNQMGENEMHSSVQWADIVKVNDTNYHFDEKKTETITEQDRDKVLGEITFTVINSEEEDNPDYQLKNNEATLLEEDSIIYSIVGEDSSRYIYSEGKVYRADE